MREGTDDAAAAQADAAEGRAVRAFRLEQPLALPFLQNAGEVEFVGG